MKKMRDKTRESMPQENEKHDVGHTLRRKCETEQEKVCLNRKKIMM